MKKVIKMSILKRMQISGIKMSKQIPSTPTQNTYIHTTFITDDKKKD